MFYGNICDLNVEQGFVRVSFFILVTYVMVVLTSSKVIQDLFNYARVVVLLVMTIHT